MLRLSSPLVSVLPSRPFRDVSVFLSVSVLSSPDTIVYSVSYSHFFTGIGTTTSKFRLKYKSVKQDPSANERVRFIVVWRLRRKLGIENFNDDSCDSPIVTRYHKHTEQMLVLVYQSFFYLSKEWGRDG